MGYFLYARPFGWCCLKNGDKGDKGDDGINGDYTEYRYAVNGSKSSAPGLVDTDRSPAGWTTANAGRWHVEISMAHHGCNQWTEQRFESKMDYPNSRYAL